MAKAREAGDGAKAEALVPVAVEPSAEEGTTAKKSKKRKVAEAQAVQAQAAEAANGAPGAGSVPIGAHFFLVCKVAKAQAPTAQPAEAAKGPPATGSGCSGDFFCMSLAGSTVMWCLQRMWVLTAVGV